MTIRRILAAAALPAVLVLAACGNSDAKVNASVDAFLTRLKAADYTGAAALVCAPERARTNANTLKAEFEAYPKPLSAAINATSHSAKAGSVDVTITPNGRPGVQYSIGLVEDRGWQVCYLDRGWI